MRELGWIDGKTARFIVHYYGYDASKVPAIARELIAQTVDVLAVTAGNGACLRVREATTTTPIVCMDMWDPILEGATSSLARPSANMTGVSWQSIDTAAKRVELAKDLFPSLKRAALIYDATDPGASIESRGFTQGAKKVGVRLDVFGVRGTQDLDAAIAAIKNSRPDVLFVAVNPFTIENLSKIA
jgi:putative tryptophan/tyrosine transport system substrate-binding protein